MRAQTLLAATASERFLNRLRAAAFEKLQALPLGFFEQERTGVLVSRLTSDVQALDEFLREAMVEVVGSGLQIALTVVVLVILSPVLALVSLVALPVLIVSSWSFHHGAGGAYHAIRDRVAETLTTLQEGLSGVRVIQAFRRERQTIDAYQPRSNAQIGAWRRASFVNIRLFTMIPLAQTVALVAVLAHRLLPLSRREDHGGHDRRLRALPGAAVRPDRAASASGSASSGRASPRSARSSGCCRRRTRSRSARARSTCPPTACSSCATSRSATRRAGLVVKDVSLRLEAGEHVALVGVTGAGKSTLAKLLTRQYDPQQGSISLGGVDLRDARLESLRHRIVMLPQEGHLFSGTIADNVRLADPEASDDAVATRAGADRRARPLRGAAGRDRHRRANARRAALGRRAAAGRDRARRRWPTRP